MTYLNQEEMDERIERFKAKRLPDILTEVKKYPDLIYHEMGNETHHRIINLKTQKFIDFWQTGTMRKIDGSISGMGYKDVVILKEIEKLAKGK